MRTLLATLLIAGAAFGSDLRAQFDRLKTQGRTAFEAGDLTTAETRYRQLLKMARTVHPSTNELYAEVVTPLAEVYRKLDAQDKLEALYRDQVDGAGSELEKGLAQADLGFYYQSNEFASVDQLMGEKLVQDSMKTFEHCSTVKSEGEQCRRRLADTIGIQAAMFFQKFDYGRAEPMFRRVITMPESAVQAEVMLVSLHALRGIMVQRKQFDEARSLEIKAAEFEAAHPNALARLRPEATRSRTR